MLTLLARLGHQLASLAELGNGSGFSPLLPSSYVTEKKTTINYLHSVYARLETELLYDFFHCYQIGGTRHSRCVFAEKLNAERWVGYWAGCWDKSEDDDDIRIPVVHTCGRDSHLNTLVGAIIKKTIKTIFFIKNIFIVLLHQQSGSLSISCQSIYASIKIRPIIYTSTICKHLS